MLASPFLCFCVVLMCFHASEALLAVAFNPRDAGWHSLLFSKPYALAMCVACVEYAAETALAPALKQAGLALVLLGELVRKAGIVTARHNFTHVVQLTRRPQHELVTRGVYAYVRHPGYLGWLLWSVGTQVMLLNPVCTLAFAVAAWTYFKRRIPFEEARLLEFFGREYSRYRAQTRTWIPGIA